jgi:hypothetical protein
VKTSSKAALGGMLAALSVVIMLMTLAFPFLSITLPVLAGLILLIAVIEGGAVLSLEIYAVVSIISLLLLADKQAALFYAVFFGYYPVIKEKTERLKNRLLEWLIKLVVYNMALTIFYFAAEILFGIGLEDFAAFGKYALIAFFIILNIVFVMYDFVFTKIITVYMLSIRRYIKKYYK